MGLHGLITQVSLLGSTKEVWDGAVSLRHEGVDVRAVTAWSLLGAYDRNSLVTRALYGVPKTIPLVEDHPQDPISPYATTKWMVERMLSDFDRAYGLKSVSFRYFNAAGADPNGLLGEGHTPETHLISLVLFAALGKRESVSVFGTDYPTRDGTCIRDYIHVDDLAQAHVLGLEYLVKEGDSEVFNLGHGSGFSV